MSRGAPLFDSHCHLGHDGADARALVTEAREDGVHRLLDVGIDAATSAAARERAHSFEGVSFSAGLHPNDADRLDEEWPAIEELAGDAACAAIGETGFDSYWKRVSVAVQRVAFERHLDLAQRLAKPVVVHCRDAFEHVFETLASTPGVPFVVHCFSGGVDEARRVLDLGGHLGFAGPLTYPRADALREVAAFAPLDRVLVETDAPFLPPQGRRGQPNRPAWVRLTAERLAEVRGMMFEELAAATTANARRLFEV